MKMSQEAMLAAGNLCEVPEIAETLPWGGLVVSKALTANQGLAVLRGSADTAEQLPIPFPEGRKVIIALLTSEEVDKIDLAPASITNIGTNGIGGFSVRTYLGVKKDPDLVAIGMDTLPDEELLEAIRGMIFVQTDEGSIPMTELPFDDESMPEVT